MLIVLLGFVAFGVAVLWVASAFAPALAQDARIDAKPLPFASKRVAASADECAVWKR